MFGPLSCQVVWFGVFSYLVVVMKMSHAKQRDDKCRSALGMQDGRIGDSQIRAKTWLYFDRRDTRYYRPHFARLNYNRLSGSWCSADLVEHPGQYIEIDLLQNTLVTGLATQGRYGGQEWVERFHIEYQRNNESSFRKLKEKGTFKTFKGNTDTNSTVRQTFSRRLILRRIRIIPLGNRFTIHCMRLELYGCIWQPSRDGLISYSAPLGGFLKRSSLQDSTYDGRTSEDPSDLIYGGLGKLTDGVIGSKWIVEYSKDFANSPWIGYINDPVMLFTFNDQRKFHSIKLHVINQKKSIRLFHKLKLEISDDGVEYKRIGRYRPSKQQIQHVGALAIEVALNMHKGVYLRCSFELKGALMLISEVEFNTASIHADTTTASATILPSNTKIPNNARDKDQNNGRNILLEMENNKSTSNEPLSFPIILTIVLVGIVLFSGLLTMLVRYCKSNNSSKRLHGDKRYGIKTADSTDFHEEEEENVTLNCDGSRYEDRI